MRMVCATACLACALAVAAAEPAHGAGFSDQAVERAINRGAAFLWARQNKQGNWGELKGHVKDPVGLASLACYALLESGVSPQDPRMARTLAWLAKQKTRKTYSLAMRCNVWLVANRTTRGKYHDNLKADAKEIWRSATRGGYTYDCTGQPQKRWDNSCTQFALLGVWAAARDRVEVPLTYWQEEMNHWQRTQDTKDGMWSYNEDAKNKRATMTVGGIASLFICYDHVYAARYTTCRGDLFYQPIKRGLAWLDAKFPATVRGKPDYYYYYGVERVALASGYKYFGTADWYKLGATKLLAAQGAHGGWPAVWNSDVISTSFALLFLIRGRHAVIFNKLQYEGYWNNRPRDLANLMRWMSRTFERTVNWQIINLKVPVSEWHDAPILYIAGSRPPEFSDADLAKLREFVLQGGSILSLAECRGETFTEAMREVYAKLFPAYRLREVPPDHEVFTRKVHFDIPGQTIQLLEVHNGVRPLVVHAETDLPLSWQVNLTATRPHHFQLAANLAKYLSGSIATLRPRGTTHWLEEPKVNCTRTITLARVKHRGNWDPEPLAYTRFRRLLARDEKVRLKILPAIKPADLPNCPAGIAHLTGTGRLKLYESERIAIGKFLDSGGTLLIDAAGGDRTFADSAREYLTEAFPDSRLRELSTMHPIYSIPKREIKKAHYRLQAILRLGDIDTPHLYGLTAGGRTPVIFSREDITGGLLGLPSHTIDGYEPETAYAILRNIVLLAGQRARQPENPLRVAPGLRYTYIDKLFSPSATGTCAGFDPGSNRKADQAVLKFAGFLDAPRRGRYVLILTGPAAAKLYLGGQEFLRHAGKGETRSEAIELGAGKHAITLTVATPPANAAVQVLWEGPGIAKQAIPAGALYHEEK